jgi:hypothetical protein
MYAGNVINFQRRPDLRKSCLALTGKAENPVAYRADTVGAARSCQRSPEREASRC